MRPGDQIAFAARALLAYPMRTALILLAMAIGVAAVIVLTALGDSARRYVTSEFAAIGTNVVSVLPGRNETVGGPPPALGQTPRDLTLGDAEALLRSRTVMRVAPVVVGNAPVAYQGRERDTDVVGTSAAMQVIRGLRMAQGNFLPPLPLDRAAPVCVLGSEVRDELFGNERAVGRWLQIGDRRFRVAGVLAPEGHSLGINFDDNVLVPVASAQTLFDTASLFRILVESRSRDTVTRTVDEISAIIKDRHEGEDDVTVITLDSVVAAFDRIFRVLTLAVGGIAAISLVVAGVLIMNVMLVSVSQRTAEIGLLKAIGAAEANVRAVFAGEALLLSVLGAGTGTIIGLGGSALLGHLFPVLEFVVPPWSVAAAFGVALVTGVISGIVPAMRAARLEPVAALARR
jgi:putative ABC transport system permease protein